MNNPFVQEICEHIDNVFRKNNLTVNHNEVRNKFSRFLMNESLCERFSYFVNKLYAKTISESELIGFVNNVVLSPLNEGFENPFIGEDEDADQIDYIDVYDGADVHDKDLYTVKRIALYDPKVTKQSYYRNHRMYAGRPFIKKDIVEECPVEIVDPMDLHAKSVRDRCFAIEYDKQEYGEPKEWMMNNGDDKIIYGMPYGNANLYRTTQNPEEANIDYEFDMDEGIIRFYAIKRIKPKDELVLLAMEE